ncbi:hypothetical protein BH11ACT2_BH11ACT2_23500 [soil metagenome]
MKWTADVARGEWIAPRLAGRGVVGGTVPRGFEAYVRVFHPVDPYETTRATWAQVTREYGTVWHAAMQWDSVYRGDPNRGCTRPQQGRLPVDLLALLSAPLADASTTPELATVGVWHGWGDLHPAGTGLLVASGGDGDASAARDRLLAELAASVSPEVSIAANLGPTLSLPDREYVLLDADVREFVDAALVDSAGIGWHSGFGPSPNLLWPADRAWFLATEIDFDSTIIGASRALIDEILATSTLESAEVDADTSLAWDADTINGVPER